MNEPAALSIFGSEKIQCFIDEKSTGGALHPEGLNGLERHREREILLVESGICPFKFRDQEYTARPGDVFFINSWQPHQRSYRGDEKGCRHWWVHFHRERILMNAISLPQPAGGPPPSANIDLGAAVREVLSRRWDAATGAGAARRSELYTGILRLLFEEFELNATRPVSQPCNMIEQIANHIAIHYGRNSSLAELEKITGRNRYCLMRAFKARCGMTIGDYIDQVRRNFVADARPRGMSQKEIAVQLGFSSPAAFWLWNRRDSARQRSVRPSTAIPDPDPSASGISGR